jgi:hypothetical protein
MQSPSAPVDVRSLLHDRLDAMLVNSDKVMDNATAGQTIHDLDDFLVDAGREFFQEVYQQKLQERIAQTEADDTTSPCRPRGMGDPRIAETFGGVGICGDTRS